MYVYINRECVCEYGTGPILSGNVPLFSPSPIAPFGGIDPQTQSPPRVSTARFQPRPAETIYISTPIDIYGETYICIEVCKDIATLLYAPLFSPSPIAPFGGIDPHTQSPPRVSTARFQPRPAEMEATCTSADGPRSGTAVGMEA